MDAAEQQARRWIAAALHCEPHQVEGVVFYNHEKFVDVNVGGKTHRVTIDKVREARREAIHEGVERFRRGEIKPFNALADGTLDLHPSQWKEVRA